ncbi:HMA domain-containing protein [Psidium guajava]|nr:HMA domain-containing protein [Psidium guajava]
MAATRWAAERVSRLLSSLPVIGLNGRWLGLRSIKVEVGVVIACLDAGTAGQAAAKRSTSLKRKPRSPEG